MQIKQLLAAALIAAAVPAAFAAAGYLDQSVPVNGKATGDFLGKINVATPVEVLEMVPQGISIPDLQGSGRAHRRSFV